MTPPPGQTRTSAFRIVIDNNDAHVFVIRDGKTEEVKTGKFRVTRLLTNAIVAAIDSGKDKDGTWVETWAFVLTLKDAGTLNAVWTRQVNNVNLPLEAKDSKFTILATGEASRAGRLQTMLERLMTLVIRPVGLALVRRTGQFDVTWRRLELLRKQGLAVHLAVDGGAASGTWAERFKRIYPQAKVLCIEPREDAQAALKALAARRSGVQVAQTLIGDTEGAVDFYEHRDQSSMLRDNGGKPWGVVRQAQLTTLDRLIAALKLPVPDLIKLDLQGAELIALRGATQCLAETQAIILEVSFIPLYHNAPFLAEIVAFMAERGFRLWDILSLWHRPLDGATAFGDFLFLRKDHSLLRDNRWSASGKFERSLFR